MREKPLIAVMATALALAGCQADEYAKEPIRLSPSVRAFFQQYQALPAPLYFAVSKDGKSAGYTYCPDGGNCAGNAPYGALENCRARANGEPCVIYAYLGRLVFDPEAPPRGAGVGQPGAATPGTVTMVKPAGQ